MIATVLWLLVATSPAESRVLHPFLHEATCQKYVRRFTPPPGIELRCVRALAEQAPA